MLGSNIVMISGNFCSNRTKESPRSKHIGGNNGQVAYNKEREFLLASRANDDILSLWVDEAGNLSVYFKRIYLIAMKMHVRSNTGGQ